MVLGGPAVKRRASRFPPAAVPCALPQVAVGYGRIIRQRHWSWRVIDPGWLPSECRHHPRARRRPRLLGAARVPRRLAVSAGRHEQRRDAARGDVSRTARGNRACGPNTSRSSAQRPAGFGTGCRAVSCGATSVRPASARSRCGSCCASSARSPSAPGSDRNPGVRSVALGRLLVSGIPRRRVQAGRSTSARCAIWPRWPRRSAWNWPNSNPKWRAGAISQPKPASSPLLASSSLDWGRFRPSLLRSKGY